MLTKVNLLLSMTRDSPPQQPTLSFEKVRNEKVGRRRREGWWVMILREFLLLRSSVEKIAKRNRGANRKNIVTKMSDHLPCP